MNLTPQIELQSPEKIKAFQEEKMKTLLHYLHANSPFYQRHFKTHKVDVSTINTLEDLQKIPTTSKDDLQQYNWDFLCVDKHKIVEYTSTSGTLGKPVTIPLTENDLQRLAYNECISFACADGTPDDLYQLMLTLDRQFMAGIAYYEGIRKLGAGMVRVGPGLPAMQWETIERLKPTTLVAVPSFIVKLIEYASQKNINLNRSSVKKAICIGESIRSTDLQLNTIGKKIKSSWDIQLYSTYASTEKQTAFIECKFGKGGHHHPELIILELLNEHGNVVQEGQLGEVTISTLSVEGMPLLRYRTGDMAIAYHEPCDCGRQTLRLGPIQGRKQQMIKLRGTTLYPQAIFEILNQEEYIADFVIEVYTGELDTDELKLYVTVSESFRSKAEDNLRSIFQSRLRVVPQIEFVNQMEIEKIQIAGENRKVKRFIDKR